MNDWALGWLRAMKPPTPPPVVRTPRIETPAPLRHTVPPEASSSIAGPEYGCVGLCIGGTCERCDGLADQISEARLVRDITRLRAREAELTAQIRALEEGRS